MRKLRIHYGSTLGTAAKDITLLFVIAVFLNMMIGVGVIGAADVVGRVRTVEIVMDELEFRPNAINVVSGETIRFVVHNRGKIAHDFTIGTSAMQKARRSYIRILFDADELKLGTENPYSYDHRNGILVEPDKTKELVWTFSKSQRIEFGCNIPLHYEGGMRGNFSFAKADTRPRSNSSSKSKIDGVALTKVTQGTHGSVVINPGNTVTYTPDADFNGTDRFTYTVTTSGGDKESATVTVTVNPVADAHDDDVKTDEDEPVIIDVLNNDTFQDRELSSAGPPQGYREVPVLGQTSKRSSAIKSTKLEPRNVRPTGNSRWVVQLASLRSPAAARKEWRRLLRRYPDILQGRTPSIVRAQLDELGVFYRLRIAGFRHKSAAQMTCHSIVERGGECLTVVLKG